MWEFCKSGLVKQKKQFVNVKQTEKFGLTNVVALNQVNHNIQGQRKENTGKKQQEYTRYRVVVGHLVLKKKPLNLTI